MLHSDEIETKIMKKEKKSLPISWEEAESKGLYKDLISSTSPGTKTSGPSKRKLVKGEISVSFPGTHRISPSRGNGTWVSHSAPRED